MTQEEILQYNKRCADFMGLEISIKLEDGYSCGTWYKPTDNENEVLPCPVMYHSDWNWIMEVVEAIEKLKFNVRITIACITIENAFDNDSNLSTIFKFHSIQGEFENKKEAVVQAINQFLIWHEQNKTI